MGDLTNTTANPEALKKLKATLKTRLNPQEILFIEHYVGLREPKSMGNIARSMQNAGYQGSVETGAIVQRGNVILRKAQLPIDIGMFAKGINEHRIADKLSSLLDAKKTQYFDYKGEIVDERVVDDHATQLKAADRCLTLLGYGKTSNVHHTHQRIDEAGISPDDKGKLFSVQLEKDPPGDTTRQEGSK